VLEAALAAGLAGEGADVELLGIVPTPAVAWWSADQGIPAAVISASHNPWGDNGVKLFAAGGTKLPDDVEERIEAELHGIIGPTPRPYEATADVGLVHPVTEAVGGYLDHLVSTLDGRRLDGMRVVVDCANGAASSAAPELLRRLGAEVDVLHAEPDGRNINDGCGSTHPESLQRRVVEVGAEVGLAFDGDADRVLAVDHDGGLVDGDHVIAMCAVDMAGRGFLKDRSVVVTVMTNLGFRLAMADHGIRVVETTVGDRYVLEALDREGLSLGGEQSGHVIFRDLATTGDGLLTGVQLLDLLRRDGRSLAELAGATMTSLPQVLRNVRVAERGLDVGAAIGDEVAAVEAALGERGRVLIRPSGTEPLVRVMVEAPTAEQADEAAARLVAAVEAAVGG